ncbi:MAG: fumarylacetoacetate hydrolase family protein [Actinomycetota bacterium]
MRLLTIRTPQGTRAARQEGDEVVQLEHEDVGALLAMGPDWARTAQSANGPRHRLGEIDLAPVIPHPEKIICLGLNYRNHIQEMAHESPAHPTLFAKYARALIGARDPIMLPAESDKVDCEAELAFVIGRPVRRAKGAEAGEAIAGFCVLNDVSMRDWQTRTTQFLQGKTFEGSTPVGPAMVSPDEVDGGTDLSIRCEVDDEVRQEASTADLLFRPAEIVAYVSTIVTLVPGDLIATGTPAGVGAARHPPLFLRPGQVVRTAIEGIGELVNECVAEPP